jgi:protein-disulfide isomerase
MIFRATLLATALATATPLFAQSTPGALTSDQVKQLALQAILENPEVVMEAFAILQRAQEQADAEAAGALLSDSRDLLENDPNAPVIGNPDGDVTVVEFFDYNCPYCRRASEQVMQAIGRDDNIRVVFREWPILGEGSVVASRAALAARAQGKYLPFHEALMQARGRMDEDAVMKIAAKTGLDMDRLRADMQSPEVEDHIATSLKLAEGLGFTGTPSFVVGEALAPGLISADQILEMVAETRAARK